MSNYVITIRIDIYKCYNNQDRCRPVLQQSVPMIRCSSNSIQTAVNQTHHNYLVFFPVTFHWVHSHGKREMRLIDGKKLAKWCNYLMKEISQEQCQGCWIQDLSHAMHNHCLVFIIPFLAFLTEFGKQEGFSRLNGQKICDWSAEVRGFLYR